MQIFNIFFLILFGGVLSVLAVPYPQSNSNENPDATPKSDDVIVTEEETTIAILRPGAYSPDLTETEEDTIVIDADSTDSTPLDEDWEPFNNPSDCLLPVEKGPCRAIIDAWAFNSATGSCGSFPWSGCGGNSNRFRTLESCQSKCGNTDNMKMSTENIMKMSTSEEPSSSSTTSEEPPKKKSHQCPRFHGCPSKKCTIVQEASTKGCKKCQCPPESEGNPFSGKKNQQGENSAIKN